MENETIEMANMQSKRSPAITDRAVLKKVRTGISKRCETEVEKVCKNVGGNQGENVRS